MLRLVFGCGRNRKVREETASEGCTNGTSSGIWHVIYYMLVGHMLISCDIHQEVRCSGVASISLFLLRTQPYNIFLPRDSSKNRCSHFIDAFLCAVVLPSQIGELGQLGQRQDFCFEEKQTSRWLLHVPCLFGSD
jgi:hypothetical protein